MGTQGATPGAGVEMKTFPPASVDASLVGMGGGGTLFLPSLFTPHRWSSYFPPAGGESPDSSLG